VETLLITEILARNARVYSDETALIERDPAKNSRRQITWEQFDAEANRVANALIARDVRKGDRVVHLMMNCIEWLPTYFGILRAGAWVVPLNFRFSGDDIKHCCEIAEAKILLFGQEFIDRIDSVKTALDKTTLYGLSGFSQC
jgi:acyl-CoA synthetase (AMP-forming)/AMP-acid ligase II